MLKWGSKEVWTSHFDAALQIKYSGGRGKLPVSWQRVGVKVPQYFRVKIEPSELP